jgi:hypothetical protein
VATPTPKLGRFRQEILESDGDIVSTATVRRTPAGAYLLDDGAPTLTLSVYDIGAIAAGLGQTIKIVDISGVERSDTWTVGSVNVTATPPTVTLVGVEITVAIAGSGNKHPRLVIASPIPTAYGDPTGTATGSNPATSDGTSGGTSGIVADYLRPGAYDVKVVAADATYVYYYDIVVPLVTGGASFDVTDVRFGAKGDNSTNDGPAINKALVEAGRTATATNLGAIVYLPPGVYLTTEPIEVPDSVSLVGSSMFSTIIKAQTGTISTYFVRMGGGAGTTDACRLYGVFVDARSVSGCIGVQVPYAPGINTLIQHCRVSTTSNHAITMGSSSVGADWTISDCYLTTTGAFSAVLTGGSTNFTIRECLMTNAGNLAAAGMIAIVGGSGTCMSIDGSGWVDLFRLTSSATVTIIGCRYGGGGGTTTNVVNIESGSKATVLGCVKGTATNLIMDNVTPSTDTSGFYLMGGASNVVLSSLSALPSTTPVPQTFSGGLTSSGTTTLAVTNVSGAAAFSSTLGASGVTTISGALTVGPRADLTAATSVTLPATGNYFRLVGATTIDTIVARAAGSIIMLESAAADNTTIRDISIAGGAANIYLNKSGGIDSNRQLDSGQKDMMWLLCDGTNWIETGNN